MKKAAAREGGREVQVVWSAWWGKDLRKAALVLG